MLYSDNIRISDRGVTFTDKHGNNLTMRETFNKGLVRIYNWWLDFKLFMIHLVSLHVPVYSIRKLVFQFAGVKIGKGTTIHMGCKFFDPSGVSIGNDTKIGDRAFLDGRAKLKIGSHVDIASEVMIYNSEHDINDKYFRAKEEMVEIEDYAFIGPRVIILPGVKVGLGAVLAAGAVITKNVPNFTIVAGIPGKIIGERVNKNPNYRLGRARLFQ